MLDQKKIGLFATWLHSRLHLLFSDKMVIQTPSYLDRNRASIESCVVCKGGIAYSRVGVHLLGRGIGNQKHINLYSACQVAMSMGGLSFGSS